MKPWLRLTLVAVTIGGGFAGFCAATAAFATLENASRFTVVLFWVSLLLYSFVAASGLLFVHNPKRTRLIEISLALQIPWISSPLVVYGFVCLLLALVGLTQTGGPGSYGVHFGVNVQLETLFKASIGQNTPWEIGVNLFPLFLLIMLRRALRMGQILEVPAVEETDYWDSIPEPPEISDEN